MGVSGRTSLTRLHFVQEKQLRLALEQLENAQKLATMYTNRMLKAEADGDEEKVREAEEKVREAKQEVREAKKEVRKTVWLRQMVYRI